MEQNMRFMARRGFMTREVAGETMLIPLNTGDLYLTKDQKLPSFNGMVRLNTLGLFLWRKLEQPCTVEELIEAVEEAFETGDQNVREDIEAFLDTGIRNQIVFLLADNLQ